MDNSNIEENKKKHLIKNPTVEKFFLTLMLVASLYAFFPLFLMQIKFFFNPEYPNVDTYYTVASSEYDHIFKQAGAIIDDSGEVCFLNPAPTKGPLFGTYKGKANYFFYPNEVKTLAWDNGVTMGDFLSCAFLVVLVPEKMSDRDVGVLDGISNLKNKYEYRSEQYSLLIYEKR